MSLVANQDSCVNLKKENKICAGNGCSNEGKHPLTIIYLNKKGWFCDSCKYDLLIDGLVVENGTSTI
jgi:hypothetical protein